MARFRVLIAPGVTHLVDAATEDEARKKTKAEIAKGSISPFYDELFFDYETGVNNRELRQKLSRAETLEEEDAVLNDLLKKIDGTKSLEQQEAVAEVAVGSDGYVRNTKGQLALTPEGMRILGLEDKIQKRTLADGSTINLNTIIDENSFNLKTGDLADFAGIAGPVVGTVAALIPQLRLVRGVASLLGGRDPLARMFLAGVGSAAGKGAEEYVDAQEGFQLQKQDDLNKLIGTEFAIGSLGQGVFGEAPAKIYQLLLGKRAPIENQRLLDVMARNLSYKDVQKLDESLGKPATKRQINKAVKEGKVRKFDWSLSKGALPAQASMQRMLTGRQQQFAEQTFGNNRDTANAKALFAELDYMLGGIKEEQAALDAYLSEVAKGGVDVEVNKALQVLRAEEQTVTESLKKLLGDIGEDILEVDKPYAEIASRREFGETMKELMGRARYEIMAESGVKYGKVDRYFEDVASPFKPRPVDPNTGQVILDPDTGLPLPREFKDVSTRMVGGEEKAFGPLMEAQQVNKTINAIVNKNMRVAQNAIREYVGSKDTYNLQRPGTDFKTGTLPQIEEIINRLERRSRRVMDAPIFTNAEEYARAYGAVNEAGIPTFGVTLRQIRNDFSDLRQFRTEIVGQSPEGRLVSDIIKLFDDYGVNQTTNQSILTEVGQLGEREVAERVARYAANNGVTDYAIDPGLNRRLEAAVAGLREANRDFATRMKPFETVAMDKLIANARIGATSADDVYRLAILGGEPGQLDDIFKGLAEYDKYLARAGQTQVLNNGKNFSYEENLKAQLKQRLFNDAFRKATKSDLTNVDFAQFAKEIKRFEADSPGKLNSLFRNSVTGQTSGPRVLQAIEQINMISPKIRPQALRDLTTNFTKFQKGKGLDSYESGKVFIDELEKLAKASDERIRFEQNRAISRLPELGIEETVNTIFRPKSAANINILKETLKDRPDVFNAVQQASMQKLLSKSIDFNGQGKITDIFKHQNLKTALDSYGDETLEAMFGKELAKDLRTFQKEIDILTLGEAGRGSGGAGGLVAAGIAASIIFNPLSALPIVTGLAIARALFSNRFFVKILTSTEQGAITQGLKIFNNTLRQFGLRFIDGEIQPVSAEAQRQLEGGLQQIKSEAGITDEDLQIQSDEGVNLLEESIRRITAPLKTSELALPEVQPTQGPTDPLSPERLAFAEQVAGRPVV
jgi:hypothetical protein